MRFVFFSMNDFGHEGGGTIRMQGIMNELSKNGQEVIFISNTKKQYLFENKIQHVFIDFPFSKKDKKLFQGVLGTLPMSVIKTKYSALFNRLDKIFKDKFDKEPIYFFEYLDNSIGYCLKSQKIIKEYINDLHGVAALEFKFQANQAKSIKANIKYNIKYYISKLLDRKVFNNAKSLIFPSQALKDYFCSQYPKVKLKNNYILPYVLSSEAITDGVNKELKEELVLKYNIMPDEKIIFFAGSLKKTGGVPDLIKAFSNIVSEYNTRLLIVGDGINMDECLSTVKQMKLSKKVVFIGRISYHHLKAYQDLATIIVCPDKQNVYSELIVHVKYLDALLSGKIVINGSFKSVKEINIDESLSINFKPSDVKSLSVSLKYCLDNLEKLEHKYRDNKQYVKENLTYASHIKVLIK